MDSKGTKTTAQALAGNPGFAIPSEEVQEEMARQLAANEKKEGKDTQSDNQSAGNPSKKDEKSEKGQ
ncbi:hypothetical protein ABW21_db0205861 [Orbilia brochopaga]|nr:hypothetical protein ABW21_db0205861 [Drechslerella brochopaga]